MAARAPGARGDTGAEGNLLTELERLLGVLLRRQTEFVTADRPVDDDPGGLVLLEVFRQHELELRTQPLRHRQAGGRVDVARHEVEVFGANAHRIEPDELPGDPKHVAGHRADGEGIAVGRSPRRIRNLPGDEQGAYIPLAQRRIGREVRFNLVGWSGHSQGDQVRADVRLADEVQARQKPRRWRKLEPALRQSVRAPSHANPSVVLDRHLPVERRAANRARDAHVGYEFDIQHALIDDDGTD